MQWRNCPLHSAGVDCRAYAPDAVRTLIAAFDGAWQSILASGAKLSAQQSELTREFLAKYIISPRRYSLFDAREQHTLCPVMGYAPALAHQSKLHDASLWVLRVRSNVESKLSAHRQHRGVLAQHLPLHGLETFRPGVFNDHLHEQIAEPAPF